MDGRRGHSTAPLRILFASTHTYLPQRVGGIESNTHDLCVRLHREGDEVAVLARLDPGNLLALVNQVRRKLPSGPRFPADERMGYPVYRGWNPIDGAPEVLRRFRPDVVVVQGSRPVPLARRFLELGAATLLYLHDVEFDRLGGELPATGLGCLANSEFTCARARRELAVEPTVIRPLIRPQAYSTDVIGDKVVFVNPHPVKGVEIAFRLAESRPDIPFLFVESWSLRPDRRREYLPRAAALGNVEWRRAVGDMREVYSRARVLLVPSLWEEAWGRVATEAQVSGIPVLASDRGGLPESVGPGGILLDPDGPFASWVEALGHLWDDRALHTRLALAALDHSQREEVQPEAIAARFRAVLVEAAGSAHYSAA